MLLSAGIDVGSSSTKAVLLDEQRQILGRGLCHSAADFAGAAERAFQQALAEAGAVAYQSVRKGGRMRVCRTPPTNKPSASK